MPAVKINKNKKKKPGKKRIASRHSVKPKSPTPLPIITITFPFTIRPHELQAFRGAVIDAAMQHKEKFDRAGIATDLFHNHREEDELQQGELIMRQPVITYQLMRQEPLVETGATKLCPAVCGVGPGAAALQLLLPLLPAQLRLHNRYYNTQGCHTIIQNHLLQLQHDQLTEYALYKWLGLNPDNYTLYKNTLPFTERVLLLQNILTKNLLGWAAQAGRPLPENELQVQITEITGISHDRIRLHGRRMLCFDLCFATNALLPAMMAIGTGTAHGYGKLRPLNSGAEHRQALQQLAGTVL